MFVNPQRFYIFHDLWYMQKYLAQDNLLNFHSPFFLFFFFLLFILRRHGHNIKLKKKVKHIFHSPVAVTTANVMHVFIRNHMHRPNSLPIHSSTTLLHNISNVFCMIANVNQNELNQTLHGANWFSWCLPFYPLILPILSTFTM